nr:ribonuclease H-like domain-containing protein [Tanacetum cinerariifolium]
MDQQNPTLAKIPILDTGKFEQWQFRIQQYLQHEHYALWEVIEFGDSYKVPASAATEGTTSDASTNTTSDASTNTTSDATGKKKGRIVTVTTEDMQKRKNDVKARTTLLLALPDEHQLRFSKHKTAQELWAAILKTFGGNEATKKTKKNLLKQQYGNFKAKGSETNKSDLDTMSLDDLYNHLKVYESEVQKKSEPDSQIMAFISSAKHSRGNEDVNTASVSTASTNVPTASANIGMASINQETACAYIASQSSGSQIKFEDIKQIDEDDMEEMDIKWNMALLSMRAYRFWKKTGKKISIQGSDVAGFDKSKSYMANDEENHALIADEETPTEFALMAKTSAEIRVFDNSLCSKDCKKNTDSLNNKITDLTDKLFDAKNMIYHYKLGLAQVESRLVEHKDHEIKYCEKIKGLEYKTESSKDYIESLKKQVELIKKEKEELETKLTGFKTASKDLDSLFESQRMDKNKEGLGYSDVPPPPAQLYSSPKKDLSWTGLPEFKDDTVIDYSRPSPTVESTLDDAQNRNSFETEASPSIISLKSFIKFVKAKDSPTNCKTEKAETTKKSPVKKRVKRGTTRSQNNTYKSPTPRLVVHRPNGPPMRPMRPNMNDARPNRTSFNKQAHSYTNRPFQRTSAVRSQYRALWVPTVNRNFSTARRKFPTANRKVPTGSTKFSTADMGKKGNAVKASAHMTGNISYLSNYEPFDGGYVSFGQGGCKITGKGTIKTECIVLGRDFKLLDDANVLLRTPRQHNMYSIDLNNIVPHKDLTCLVAKASADECMIWHRRLGHLKFKRMNRLVRHNLVRGLPSKCFKNDHTCTACLKGK